MVEQSQPDADSAPTPGRVIISISPEAWSRLRDPKVILALVLGLAGAIAEIAGYWGASGTIDPGEQLPYIISGGIGGIFLLGAAAMLLFSADMGLLKRQVSESTVLVRELGEQISDLQAQLAASEAPRPKRSRAT